MAWDGWWSSDGFGPGHLAVADQLAERGEPELVGLGLGHDDDRRAAVGDLGGVAGGDGAVLVERRAQLAQRLGGRLGPHALVGVDHQRVALALGHLTGTISSANLPSLMAAAARSWERALKASWRSRETPSAPL